MSAPDKNLEAGGGGPADGAAIRDMAASWIVRRDRRLTAAEAVELQTWLDADARHAAAFEQSGRSWRTFRELGSVVRRAPEPVPAAPARSYWPVVGGLAAAAAVVLALVVFERAPVHTPAAAVPTAAITAEPVPLTRRLADGSVARLKAGAEITETFTEAERRVRLVRGEAFFTVAKDAARPFYVEVGDVTVRAVGTAFAVRFASDAVDVLVTEGTVQVTPPTRENQQTAEPGGRAALVDAGHRAFVARATETTTAAVVVSAVSAAEIAHTLAWNTPMLELAGATLGELVATFARQSGRRIEIADSALGAVRIGGRFPNEDVDGFVRVLEEVYEVKSERRVDGTIVLRKAR